MKKTLIAVSLLLSLCIIPLSAAAEVIGHIYKTDIKAYENYLQIPSYNCGGTTVVFVRDLENYGYDVIWNEAARKVEIIKNTSKQLSPIPPEYSGEGELGEVLYDIYKTDIKTYFGGKLIASYNIGGKTAINLRSLDAYDNMKFDTAERKALFFSKEINVTDEEIEHIEYMYEILDSMSVLDCALEKAVKMAESGKYDKTVMEELGRLHDDFLEVMNNFSGYSEPYMFSESTLEFWWSMVNLDLAATKIKASWNVFEGEEAKMYERYIFDSTQQRKTALALLAAEF